ncbi:MAG: FkbM family methyltransferase [Alphaproteobacteria bacterium]|nr:FkbM family methyltransferase [Alphaproteobacteria bacterium]
MDLYHHSNPPFTKWVVAEGLLAEPFVVIDVGVQGGEHPRWQFLETYAEIHGFDPIAEVIDDLRKRSDGRGRSYHNLALGNEDGERNFYVSANRFNSSFYASDPAAEERLVTIRRLDTLYRDRAIPRADYIKLDCEGFEPEILRGARQYLAAGDVLCVTAETSFNVSPIFPRTHFHAVNKIMADYGLLVHDINEIRTPTASYSAALSARPPRIGPQREARAFAMGRLATCDVMFCRNFAEEWRNPENFGREARRHPAVDTLIKSMINFELHGLMDCALDVAATFRAVLSPRLDVDRAVDLLLIPPPHPRNTADVIVWLQAEQRSICNRLRQFAYRIPPLRILNTVAQRLLRKSR